MATSESGSEHPPSPSDRQRAAWLDECIALSALCLELMLAGAAQREEQRLRGRKESEAPQE